MRKRRFEKGIVMLRSVAKLVAGALATAALAPAAHAQLFLSDPGFAKGRIEASDPLVGIPLPGATAEESRAHLLWNLRSGLNVAALQCQFSPYLRTVANYNALLGHHSRELASAYGTLEGYFRRVHGPRTGPRQFDDYSTQTYNNFSTLQAQLGFCQTAADIGKQALARPKGELHQVAAERVRELRSSLQPAYEPIVAFNTSPVPLVNLAALLPDCTQLRGRERRRCEQGA